MPKKDILSLTMIYLSFNCRAVKVNTNDNSNNSKECRDLPLGSRSWRCCQINVIETKKFGCE